jgi:hypothetical protein
MPKAQPKLVNADTGEVHDVKQYQFPVRGEPVTLIINGDETVGRRTAWRDLRYTYFKHNDGQFFVAGHISDDVQYTIDYPEGFVPTAFKSDREAMAARVKELKAAKAADAPAVTSTGPGDDEEDEDDEPADDATLATTEPKKTRTRRKVAAETSAEAV